MVPKAIMLNLVQYVFSRPPFSLISLRPVGLAFLSPPISPSIEDESYQRVCCFERITDNNKNRHTRDEMQKELLENMYRTSELDDLLRESEYTIRRRKECQQMVESLSRASEIVSQVQ